MFIYFYTVGICFKKKIPGRVLALSGVILEDCPRKHSVFPRSRQSPLNDKHNKARKQVNLLRAYYAEREFAAQLLMRGLAPNKYADFEICFANSSGALRLQECKKQLEDYPRKHSVFPRSRQSPLNDKHNKARKQVNLLRAYYAYLNLLVVYA